jgi:phosphatidylglycerol:prolipoprotein diacylglycerol transferase
VHIDPVIFSVTILGLTLTLRWYGVLVMLGAVVGGWFAEKEVNRRGAKGELVWDAMVYVIPAGVIGARLWYVMNTTLGGNDYYLQQPIQILNIPQGGLHFFGGLLFGALALILYLRQNKLDPWMFLDAIAPVTLIGQAVARPANFINQELYGQPTTLPWGIPIDAAHRIAAYADMSRFPESTRFHPTFAYEMIWNFAAAALLLWLARRYADKIKPGTMVGGWLVLAGVGRALIEIFRPDQPKIPGTPVTYSALVSILMAVAGVVILLVRFGKLRLGSLQFPEAYKLAAQPVVAVEADSAAPLVAETEDAKPSVRKAPARRVTSRTTSPKKTTSTDKRPKSKLSKK